MEDLDGYMARIVGKVAVCETARQKRPGVRGKLRISKFRHGTDQRPTTHASCIINRPPRTRLFQSLAIKQLTLDREFEVLNALVINHRSLWRLEMPLWFPCERVCRFRWLSGKK
jgi:hypothetical protein